MMLKNMGNATDSNYAGMKVCLGLYYHHITDDIVSSPHVTFVIIRCHCC